MANVKLIKPSETLLNGGIALVVIGLVLFLCGIYLKYKNEDSPSSRRQPTVTQSRPLTPLEFAKQKTGLSLCGAMAKHTASSYEIMTTLSKDCLDQMNLDGKMSKVKITIRKGSEGRKYVGICANGDAFESKKTVEIWGASFGCPPPIYFFTEGEKVRIEYTGVK